MTHSLIGLCVGKSQKQATKQKEREALVTSILASNLPDLDLVYTFISGVAPLGYLMHHRGHTHTILGVALIAVFAFYLGSLLSGGRARWDSRIFFLSLAGVFLHLLFDFFNSYGVHPFWPLNNDWIYGDSLFIIEPTIWFSLLAYALWSSGARALKIFWSLLSLFCFVIFWVAAPLSLAMKLVLSFLFVVMQAFQAKERGSLTIAWSSLASILVVFVGCSIWAEWRLRKHIETDFVNESVIQLARTPQPGNPFCWNNIMVAEADPHLYVARVGTQSLLPGLLNCDRAVKTIEREGLKPLQPPISSSEASGEIYWNYEHLNSMAQLRDLALNNCRASSALQFYRAPIWNDRWMEDLRFIRGEAPSFAWLDLHPEKCPDFVTNWTPPLNRALSPTTIFDH